MKHPNIIKMYWDGGDQLAYSRQWASHWTDQELEELGYPVIFQELERELVESSHDIFGKIYTLDTDREFVFEIFDGDSGRYDVAYLRTETGEMYYHHVEKPMGVVVEWQK